MILTALALVAMPIAGLGAVAVGTTAIPDCADPAKMAGKWNEADLTFRKSDIATLDATTYLYVADRSSDSEEKEGVWTETNGDLPYAVSYPQLQDTLQTESCVGKNQDGSDRVFYTADNFEQPLDVPRPAVG